MGYLQPWFVDALLTEKQQIDVDDPGALGPICRPDPAEHAFNA